MSAQVVPHPALFRQRRNLQIRSNTLVSMAHAYTSTDPVFAASLRYQAADIMLEAAQLDDVLASFDQ